MGARSPYMFNFNLISPYTSGVSNNLNPSTSIYFQGIPVTLKAPDIPAAIFSHLEINGSLFHRPVVQVLQDTVGTVRAVFEEKNISHIASYQLAKNNYFFTVWDEGEPAGSFPESMAFVYMDRTDPEIDAEIGEIGRAHV